MQRYNTDDVPVYDEDEYIAPERDDEDGGMSGADKRSGTRRTQLPTPIPTAAMRPMKTGLYQQAASRRIGSASI